MTEQLFVEQSTSQSRHAQSNVVAVIAVEIFLFTNSNLKENDDDDDEGRRIR